MNEFLSNADIAFSNKQYDESLSWYKKVLEENPNDLYSLTRAGTICAALGSYEEALSYFGAAKDLDPTNGDIIFNYGNVCFFNKDYQKAFSMYIEAEKAGCSDDILPRLFYQMAMLCSARQDIKSALFYFDKCEEADKTCLIAMTPDLISEKLKLYMSLKDYDNSEQCAAQLVAIAPAEFNYYMIYFSILMAHKDYKTAEKVLNDASKYAAANDKDRFSVLLQRIALNASKADDDPENKNNYLNQAISLTEEALNSDSISDNEIIDLKTSLAELYSKLERYDKSIEILNCLLMKKDDPGETITNNIELPEIITEDEIDSMIETDIDSIQEKIDSGELSDDLGAFVPTYYDESGREVPVYDDNTFDFLNKSDNEKDDISDTTTNSQNELSAENKEKIIFSLISNYLAIDDFKSVEKLSKVLKHSDNKYYSYYALYTSTMSLWKINGFTDEVEREYAKAIAFFRNKSFSDPSDVLALIFRARLYAESGKFDKAKEIALLLSDADRSSVMEYIKTCQEQ